MKKQLLNQEIADLIASDYDFNSRQQLIITNTYKKATSAEKEKIDEIFIALTGYSLKTIISNK